jgi:hypothetical protein
MSTVSNTIVASVPSIVSSEDAYKNNLEMRTQPPVLGNDTTRTTSRSTTPLLLRRQSSDGNATAFNFEEYVPEFTFPAGMKAAAKPCFALAMWLSLMPLNDHDEPVVPRHLFAANHVLEAFHTFYEANLPRMKAPPKRASKAKAKATESEEGEVKPKRAPRKKAVATGDSDEASEESEVKPKAKRASRAKPKTPEEEPVDGDVVDESIVAAAKPKRASRAKPKAPSVESQLEEPVDGEAAAIKPKAKRASRAKPNAQVEETVSDEASEEGEAEVTTAAAKPKRAPRKKAAAKTDVAPMDSDELSRPNMLEQSYIESDVPSKKQAAVSAVKDLLAEAAASPLPQESDDETDEVASTNVSTRKFIHEGVEYLKSDNDDLFDAKPPHNFIRNLHDEEEEEEEEEEVDL